MRTILFLFAILATIHGIVPTLFAQENKLVQERLALPTRAIQAFTPEISLNALFSAAAFSDPNPLIFGAHDPDGRGFTLQNMELTLVSNIDPYFRGEAHLIFGLEKGESFIEVEEAFLTTLALPYGLQIKGGHFFTSFGRQNPKHPHAWDFADQTIVNTLMFGGDGLRSPGVQISALLPLPFYLELIGSAQNANGETATSFLFAAGKDEDGDPIKFADREIIDRGIRSTKDFLYLGRIKSGFDLSDTVSLVVGGSHLSGPNGTGDNTDTRIHGADLFVKWRPLKADHGWPFVSLQAETMRRVYEAGATTTPLLSDEVFKSDGSYVQALYGFTRRWVAGVRYEKADAPDPSNLAEGGGERVSSNLTFYPSEFSKIRLQYNRDSRDRPGKDAPIEAVFVQYEFLLGAHGAHTF